MKKQNYFVKSNYPRRAGDYYPTIDSRCVTALTESVIVSGLICDPCAPDGSGIVDSLLAMGRRAKGIGDAYKKNLPAGTQWVVCNPPYKLGLVDKIISTQVDRIKRGQIEGVAMLLRTGFDHAKKYTYLFKNCEEYSGQIKMLFRPRWIEDSKGSPIHNYVWHIWQSEETRLPLTWVLYW